MKRSSKMKLVSFSTAFLVILGGFLLNSRLMLHSTSTELEYAYRRALNDLTDYVSGMRSALKKAAYVNTPVLRSSVSAQLLEQSGGAKAAMAALPFSQEKTERISRFLSQVGDYALFLTRKTASGDTIKEQELQGLETLRLYAEKLTNSLLDIQDRLSAEEASIGRTESLLNNVDEMETMSLLDSGIDQAATEFAEFPSLLYDGPFSDHISRREPLFLKDKPEITEEEAASRAAAFLNCTPEELSAAGSGGTALAVYSFTCGDSRVNITKAGGEIAYFKKSGPILHSRLSYEEALRQAGKILKSRGITSFRESYYVINDNLCTINFAAQTFLEGEGASDGQQVTCYPDLVKVTIELNEGDMVEYDASGYLMNHRSRELAPPALSAEMAAKNISPLLTPESPSLALIPTPGLEEVLCWEFHCTDKEGGEALVYLNAFSGLEEQLYLLQKDDHGVLVI